MIIATVTALLLIFGGDGAFSFQIFNKAIQESISDKALREELVAEVDRSDEAMKAFREDFKNMTKEFEKASARHDATRAELDRLLTRIDNRRMETTRELLDSRFSLRDKMTEEQWNAMYELALEKAQKGKE